MKEKLSTKAESTKSLEFCVRLGQWKEPLRTLLQKAEDHNMPGVLAQDTTLLGNALQTPTPNP